MNSIALSVAEKKPVTAHHGLHARPDRRTPHGRLVRGGVRWLAMASVVLGIALPGTALAQVPPFLDFADVTVFEGNSGTSEMVFNVILDAPAPTGVTATVNVIPLTGSAFNAATAGVDFVQITNGTFSIPPNGTTGQIRITIFGDSTIEPAEHIAAILTNVVGAQVFEGTNIGVGTILNDDGPPSVRINDISTSEPVSRGSTKTTSFTVSLSHPSTQPVSVAFATRNGTAVARTGAILLADYIGKSGVLSIPANTLSATITVSILGDAVSEPSQTFFMDLSNPTNCTVADPAGVCTIRDTTLQIFTGGFDLSPDNARPEPGETVLFSILWTVPDDKVWRDLKTIDLRIRDHNKTALWVRWEESTDLLSLCAKRKTGVKHEDDASARQSEAVVCTPGDLPGSDMILGTDLADLDLSQSSVVGSGPDGKTVTLNLAVRFLGKAEGRSFDLELAAADDFFQEDEFALAGEVKVLRVKSHPPKAK